MRSLTSLVIMCLMCTLLAPLTAQAQRESQRDSTAPITRFKKIEEVIQGWSEERQLYVRGDVGVGDAQLRYLADWLKNNAPHWVVVLLDNSNGQFYEPYEDFSAVESALGNALSNRTQFGTLVHPETQEADGAVLVMSIKERAMSYFASDAQDSRDLGEAHWLGELDQPAIRAMQSGRRIVDAVKDTVKTVNGKLARSIAAEKQAKIRMEQQRERQLAQVTAELADLRASIKEVEGVRAEFVKEYPKADGLLAHPPTEKWLETISQLEKKLATETVNEVEQQHANLENELARYLNAYAATANFKAELASASTKLAELGRSTNSQTQQIAERTRKMLTTSSQQLESGELTFLETLADSKNQLKLGEKALAEEAEQARLIEIRNRGIKATALIMLSIIALITSVLLWLANRRRAGTMQKAVEHVSKRLESIAAETDRLDKLFQRNEDILGSRENLKERGYEGTTQKLAAQALDYVDDLFIMSKEVKRVVAEAQRFIHPTHPWHKLVNLFSAARYQDAIDHVTGAPLKFTRVTGIPLIVRDMGIGKTSATSESGIPDEVSLSFDEIFGVLQKRGVEAEQALSLIEECLANVQDKLTETQKLFQTATEQEKALDSQAAADGYFDAPDYFSALLPAVDANLKRADQLSAFDAVQAVQGPLAIASRQLNEAMQLARFLQDAREKLFPKLQADAESLKQRGYASQWIGTQIMTITRAANDLFKKAATESIAADNAGLQSEIDALALRSTRVVELATQIDEALTPSLQSLEREIADTRAEVAGKLKLKPEQILQELDRNPDDELNRARVSLEAAKAMLLQGRVSAVEEAIATIESAKQVAAGLLAATKDAVKAYADRRQRLLQAVEASESKSPQLKRGIEAARGQYEASALVVNPSVNRSVVTATIIDGPSSAAKPTTAMPVGRSMDWYLSEAVEGLQEVKRLLNAADAHHRSGEILTASEELSKANEVGLQLDGQLQQIEEHLQLLDSRSRENVAHQQRNEQLIETLQRAERNPRVTATTLSAIHRGDSVVSSNRRLVQTQDVLPNPFETAQVLLQTQRQLEQLQAQIVGDEQAFAEARRAAAGARQQLEQANQRVRQSQSDGIPDSQQIVQTNSHIAELSRQLNSIENDLEVPHGDWQSIDARAARVQAELSSSAKTLESELSSANQALAAFQQASQLVLQAGQWSGPWGVRVPGSPGVSELERARRSLQSGNYSTVLQISQMAFMVAQAAIQQAEREVARRRMEEERAREAERRAREEAHRRASSPNFGGGGFGGGSFGGGGFSSGSSSSSSGGSSSHGSAAPGSGFSRSGW